MQQTFDAGNHFVFSDVNEDNDNDDDDEDSEGVQQATRGRYTLHAAHELKQHEDVVLIDHMWTTTFPQARAHLRTLPGLAARVAAMLAVDVDEGDEGDHDKLWRALWAHLSCYVLPQSDDYTRWFLHDEVGTAVGHSVAPNVKCCPLLVDPGAPGQEPYALSLLWPVRDLAEGARVTRDYLPNVPAADPTRPLRMIAFAAQPCDAGGAGAERSKSVV